jgi:glucose dehydrogenase
MASCTRVQNSEVVALDAVTGRNFWTLHYTVPPESNGYLMVVKGLAISGDRLFPATYDGHLIAIDSKTGRGIGNKVIVDWQRLPAQHGAAHREKHDHHGPGDQ